MRRGAVVALAVLSVALSPALAQPVVSFADVGLATPESVLYDEQADVYLVSNVNGGALTADDNGFISRLSPDGEVLELKWIDGADPAVELNEPKGLAIGGNTLYVADIDTVRMFDRETGEPRGSATIQGASFLNDMAAAPDGSAYVTDTGVDASFAPTGTDAIYHVTPDGQVETVIQGTDLANPNGLVVLPSGDLFVAAFDTEGTVYEVVDGMQQDVRQLDVNQLDGVVALPGGDLLVSSWSAAQVVRLSPNGQTAGVVDGVTSPADIGYDSTRNRLLVPIFMESRIEVYQLPDGQ